MMEEKVHVFVDGGYLREVGREAGIASPDPYLLSRDLLSQVSCIQYGNAYETGNEFMLTRVIYYDAIPDDDAQIDGVLRAYWDAIELQHDTQLGFGALRGRKRRQKRVDTLMATHMLSGAFSKRFDCAGLVAGDADFVPIVQELRRYGVRVFLASEEGSLSNELRREVDRVALINEQGIQLGELKLPNAE